MAKDDIKGALRRVETLLAEGEFEPRELERCAAELTRVAKRLEHREYKQYDFSGKTFDIGIRVKEAFWHLSAWADIGRTWARIFARFGLDPTSTVIDLCPGWSAKIELGLHYSGFRGEVHLVDANEEALTELVRALGMFDVQFRVTPRLLDVFRPSVAEQPRGVLVMANHVIDDLCLFLFGAETGSDVSGVYSDEEKFVRVWEELIAWGSGREAHVAQKLAEAFERFVAPGGALFLSQYQSYAERILELRDVTDFCVRQLDLVCGALEQKGFRSDRVSVEVALAEFDGYFAASDCRALVRAT